MKAEGVYNERRQLQATKINFKGDDLEDAQKIKAGHARNQDASSAEQGAAGAAERGGASAKRKRWKSSRRTELNSKQAERNMAAIAANSAGFSRLDEYYIWDEVTGTLTTVRSKSIPRTTRNCARWRRRPRPSTVT